MDRRADGAEAVVRAGRRLDTEHAGALHRALRELEGDEALERVDVDLEDVESIDSAGVSTLTLARRRFEDRGVALRVVNVTDEHRSAFELASGPERVEPERTPREGLVVRLGRRAVELAGAVAEAAKLAGRTVRAAGQWVTRRVSLPKHAITEQASRLGADAFPIVALLSALLGLVLAMQGQFQLSRFGAQLYVADLLGISMVREFGPLLTAIILAGRSGASVAAELGTMKVSDEVDALRTIGVDVTGYLVLPRVAAFTLVQPALTLFSMAFGILGGLSLLFVLGLPVPAFWARLGTALSFTDVIIGLTKGLLFSWIVAFTGVIHGMRTEGAATSVGKSTTRAVVTSIFLIIVTDSIFTTISTTVRGA